MRKDNLVKTIEYKAREAARTEGGMKKRRLLQASLDDD
jgi:hypothetical protein